MNVTVENNEVHVNSVDLVVDHDDVKIYHMELRTKRPMVYAATGTDEDSNPFTEIILVPGEETKLLDESKKGVPTVVTFTGYADKDDRWMSMLEYGRYSVYVTMYRLGDSYLSGVSTEVWSDGE